MEVGRILWRRVDLPGHDACRLEQLDSGWLLEGFAAYRHETGAAVGFTYEAECDSEWRTVRGSVRFGAGSRTAGSTCRSEEIRRGTGSSTGEITAGLEECVDLDLGFTPATNLFHVRRMGLGVGESADVPAAWLDFPDADLRILRQRYERRGASEYRYEALEFEYADTIPINETGFIARYPGLWEPEPLGA